MLIALTIDLKLCRPTILIERDLSRLDRTVCGIDQMLSPRILATSIVHYSMICRT